MNLKKILKILRLNESTISMVLGALVIVVVGLLVVNYFRNKEEGQTIPAGSTTKGEGAVSLPTTHKVEKGENLWSISEKYYKTGYNWVDIAKENNLKSANDISEGQELKIPDVKPRIAEAQEITPSPRPLATSTPKPAPTPTNEPTVKAETTASPISGDKYTVVKGDNLWNIAVRAYGDGFKWVEIAKANKLVNPNLIHSGNVFVIPR